MADEQRINLWGRQPAIILGLVQSALALVISFGLDLSGDQVSMIMGFTAALLGFITSSQVSPVAKIEAAVGVQGARDIANTTTKPAA